MAFVLDENTMRYVKTSAPVCKRMPNDEFRAHYLVKPTEKRKKKRKRRRDTQKLAEDVHADEMWAQEFAHAIDIFK